MSTLNSSQWQALSPYLDQALALAQAQSTGVVNLLALQAQSTDTIMLQVRFAEVERSARNGLPLSLLASRLSVKLPRMIASF